jgi:hypothetical protein
MLLTGTFFFISVASFLFEISLLRSPWEAIEPFYSKYNGKFPTEMLHKYASMISNMDYNIGRVLDTVDKLGISEKTFIFFTSDNGPENGAGFPGPFKGRKRLLTEGGIRVPAIAQWKGKVAPGTTSDKFAITTDIYPTLVQLIGHSMPRNIRLDGVSFLPILLDNSKITAKGDERIILWYTHSPGYPKFTAARAYGYKVLWNDYEKRKTANLPAPWRVFDMYSDEMENNNLYFDLQAACSNSGVNQLLPNSSFLNFSALKSRTKGAKISGLTILALIQNLELEMHFFRFKGQLDWHQYHQNKPYETNQHSCLSRSIQTAESFPWISQDILPYFCGSMNPTMISHGHRCSCKFDDCVNFWQRESDQDRLMLNPTYVGLTNFAPMKGSYQSYLQTILKWTNFKSVCGGSTKEEFTPLIHPHDAVTRSSIHQIDRNEIPCHAHLHLTPDAIDYVSLNNYTLNSGNSLQKPLNSEGNGPLNFAHGDFFSDRWQRVCHQKVYYNPSLQANVLLAHSCAFDKPIYTLNIKGMMLPAPLCPESFQKIMHPQKQFNLIDDNLLNFLLHLFLLPKALPFGKLSYRRP